MSISTEKDERCVQEWCSFTSMGPPHPVTSEELIGSQNLAPYYVQIKYKLITILHL